MIRTIRTWFHKAPAVCQARLMRMFMRRRAEVLLTAWIVAFLAALAGCSGGGGGGASGGASPTYGLSLAMTRTSETGISPFRVTATLTRNGVPYPGQALTSGVPKGTASAITDHGDGTYSFVVTPSATGTYPVTVSYGGVSIVRKAVVLDGYQAGAGQPMAVPGDVVNTAGYEDGAAITPDGQYLFVQYGPWHLSGLLNLTGICSAANAVGYDLNGCAGRTDSSLVFDSIGPTGGALRPDFPVAGLDAGKLRHLPSLVIPGVANGIVGFPTVFYGFKRQSDGSFAEPFKVAFNDERGLNGPFGLSFRANGDGTATFVLAWNNYFNDLGDDKPDIYTGSLTLGQPGNLGDVVYSGEAFASITPNVTPVGFASHTGVQGNPHLYADSAGSIKSIWVDDEQVTNDLAVYRLASGSFPDGTWSRETLPATINTSAHEDQPFFTGDKLIFSRDERIVYHDYRPTNGACASGYSHDDCWGPEVVVLTAAGHTAAGEIFAVGEPTVATVDGRRFLYFVYVESRGSTEGGTVDWNTEVAFVELPS